MELAGEAYLLNLSLVAMGFASVSALVMLIRQMLGGDLSVFDLHLILGYLTGSLAVALGALVPPVIVYAGGEPTLVWGLSGVLGALLVISHVGGLVWRRLLVLRVRVPPIFIVDMSLQVVGAAILLLNSLPQFRNTGYYAIGLMLVLSLVMFAFVRRIGSLVVHDGRRAEQFDPTQG